MSAIDYLDLERQQKRYKKKAKNSKNSAKINKPRTDFTSQLNTETNKNLFNFRYFNTILKLK